MSKTFSGQNTPSEAVMYSAINDLLQSIAEGLPDEDNAINGQIAMTNAEDFSVNWAECKTLEQFDSNHGTVRFTASVRYSGAQVEGKGMCGTEVDATLKGIAVVDNEGDWDLRDVEVVSSHIVFDGDEEE